MGKTSKWIVILNELKIQLLTLTCPTVILQQPCPIRTNHRRSFHVSTTMPPCWLHSMWASFEVPQWTRSQTRNWRRLKLCKKCSNYSTLLPINQCSFQWFKMERRSLQNLSSNAPHRFWFCNHPNATDHSHRQWRAIRLCIFPHRGLAYSQCRRQSRAIHFKHIGKCDWRRLSGS